MIRRVLLSLSGSERARTLVSTVPLSRAVVDRYVAGEGDDDAVRVAGELSADGLLVTIDRLGEDVLEPAHAEATRDAYLGLLRRLADEGLASSTEVSVKLSAMGQALPTDGDKVA